MWHRTDHTTGITSIASQHEEGNTHACSTSDESGHKGWPLSCCLRLSLIVIRQRLFIGIGSLHWTPSNYVARD